MQRSRIERWEKHNASDTMNTIARCRGKTQRVRGRTKTNYEASRLRRTTERTHKRHHTPPGTAAISTQRKGIISNGHTHHTHTITGEHCSWQPLTAKQNTHRLGRWWGGEGETRTRKHRAVDGDVKAREHHTKPPVIGGKRGCTAREALYHHHGGERTAAVTHTSTHSTYYQREHERRCQRRPKAGQE